MVKVTRITRLTRLAGLRAYWVGVKVEGRVYDLSSDKILIPPEPKLSRLQQPCPPSAKHGMGLQV